MEKIPGTVQEPPDPVASSVGRGVRSHAATGRRHQHHVRHHNRRDRGFRARVPIGEEPSRVDQTGASRLPLVSNFAMLIM